MRRDDFDSAVSGVAALNDATRRRLYRFAIEAARPVGRDEAAKAAGIPRSVAAFHLDRLVEVGLLDVEFRRLTGRVGPGAGRPAKLYRRADREVDVSLPERRYDVAGKLLARAVNDAMEEGVPIAEALERAAVEFGRSLGEEAARRSPATRRGKKARLPAAVEVLEECGFEPRSDGPDVVLGNCPFRALADEYPDLVCGMNVHLAKGLLAGLRAPGVEAVLDPQQGRCCVRLRDA